MLLFSDFEPYVKRIFNPKKGEIVFDVGAHIGTYTLRTAKMVGRRGLVVSFEPDEDNFHLLQKNVEINGFKNVLLIKAALGKNDEVRLFYMAIDPLFSSFLSYRSLVDVREERKVQVMTLDRIVQKLKLTHIDWIKIDVEGSEMDVLEGGEKSLKNLVRRVIIETDSEKVLRFLRQRNFKISRLFGFYYFASKN
jgi:FkbM family methyltransferase